MILDTNALSALVDGDLKLEKVLSRSDIHQIPAIVLGEYRYGLHGSKKKKIMETLLSGLEEELKVLAVDATTATYYAMVRWQLRNDGKPIPENDIWIAALSLQHGLAIVTKDKHFKYVQGLKVKSW